MRKNDVIDQVPLPDTRGVATARGRRDWLRAIWLRYENSALPLGFKWSMSIALLIIVAMGVLGFFLIQQQEAGYRNQAERYSQLLVAQLGRVAGEPLMAGDSLALQVLLKRHAQDPLILGVGLYDAEGELVASEGIMPPLRVGNHWSSPAGHVWEWQNGRTTALSYVSPVQFQDVTAGRLTVTFDRSQSEADLDRTTRFLFVSTLLMIGVGVLLGALLAYRLSRPIQRLAEVGENLHAALPVAPVVRRDEIGQVLQTFRQLADGMRARAHAEDALSRYVSADIARQVLDGHRQLAPGGSSVDGSVLFCDIVGFTELSESREPVEIATLLNDYFGYMAVAAESCGGTVDKFIGDCIMIVFGVAGENRHHALHAMTCGMLIQRLADRINVQRLDAGFATVSFRIGISSGSMLAGHLGSAERLQFTVVGDTVNVAARLCDMAAPGGVLMSEKTLAHGVAGARTRYRSLGAATIKGRREQVTLIEMDVEAVARDVDADRMIDQILHAMVPR